MRQLSQDRLDLDYAPMENEHAMKPVPSDRLDAPRKGTSGAMEITAEEREIDGILADSFPASDSPPWTLGVQPELATPESTKLDVSAKSHRR